MAAGCPATRRPQQWADGTDPLGRIEVEAAEVERLASAGMRKKVAQALRDLGYTYVAADLDGFRSGSMNEVLDLATRDPDPVPALDDKGEEGP